MGFNTPRGLISINELLKPDDKQEEYGVKEIYPDELIGFRRGNKNHKYIVTLRHNDKIYNIRFGHKDYGHYYDKLEHYYELNHNDNIRREAYLRRATKIKNKLGQYTVNDPTSSNYYAVRVLW